MKIAVEGCAHGELDNIYDSIKALEENEKIKVDLLICCGDFQSVRNESDLHCMNVPTKYMKMCTFHKYYSGERVAPILTIFIGGNHEASNYLQELPYGGWVAPNIYYLGYAGVINIGGLRIAGISGIYKGHDYFKGHFEMTPYSEDSKRSVYHIRNVEVFRLKQLKEPIDIFLSHDWPSNIVKYGNKKKLLKYKPFFRDDIEAGKLGSVPCSELLMDLKPKYWFAAHLHCKFAALVDHENGSKTKFLALDKCNPNKRFLQILDIPHTSEITNQISYDPEWLTILLNTNHLFSVKYSMQIMPTKACKERYNFTPNQEELEVVIEKFKNNFKIHPDNFVRTGELYSTGNSQNQQPLPKINPQTSEFCSKLGILDPTEILIKLNGTLDLSQISDLSHNESCNNTSFIVDSDSSRGSSFSSPIKRSSLNLPTPINEDSTDDDFAICTFISPTERTSLNLPTPINEDSAEDSYNRLVFGSSPNISSTLPPPIKENSTEETEQLSGLNLTTLSDDDKNIVGNLKEEGEEELNDSPSGVKKFKRRNASIYDNNEDR